MRVKYRFAIIGVFVLAAMATAAFLPGTDRSAPAATLTATSQPISGTSSLPPEIERLLGAPNHPAYSLRGSGSGVAQNCIAKGNPCVINGTACCAGSSCQGTFPNTSCQ